MDKLSALRTFVAVAQRGSFSEAARALHMSPTAASRAIGELEVRLGVLLLRRTTRSVSLTPEGAVYLDRCRNALDELDDAEQMLRGETAAPRGVLRLTAPELFGRMHIVPIAMALMAAHADLNVELVLTDRIVKLVEDGVDIAVRIADLSDSALHAIRVTENHRVLVASPDYLARRGVPESVAHLHDHDLIVFDNFAPNNEWRFGALGKPAIRVEPRLLTNNVSAAICAAISGGGIARLMCYQTVDHVRSGELRYVLTEFNPPAVPINLVFQAKRRSAPNVRAFIEAARSYFGRDHFDCGLHA